MDTLPSQPPQATLSVSQHKNESDFLALDVVAAMVEHGDEPEFPVRTLLKWFGATRRGSQIVEWIRSELLRRGLVTEPDFSGVWIGSSIRIKKKQVAPPVSNVQPQEPGRVPVPNAVGAVATTSPAQLAPVLQQPEDPIRRIILLEAANQKIVCVPPGTSINEAMTIMMLNDFSQLPVLQSERQCKGAITWQSIATARALGNECMTVNDCLVPVQELPWDMGLLEAIPKVVENGFALVRGRDNRFQGVVTVVDLSLEFKEFSEPFLLLEQIENLLRVRIRNFFSLEEISRAKHSNDTTRVVGDVSDLNFGEYVRLVESSEAWPKLKFAFERGPFIAKLKEVLEIRNDVMHFSPDPLSTEDIALLRSFAGFLRQVVM